MMGGQNCHADIIFADGVTWIARFRLSSAISPPPNVRDYVLRSEAATMEFLDKHTKIPSPSIFDWACESDPANVVGVGYILMEKMPGKPLDWQRAKAEQREKVVQQLADVMLEIERHPFDHLGSLMVTDGEPRIQVKGLARHSTAQSGVHDDPLGPFQSSHEAMRTLVEATLKMIAHGEIGTADNAVDVFLAHRFRLDVLDSVWNPTATDEKFFLKHADDKGDHILVNDDFDITGVIDWEWCSTASRKRPFPRHA
jgi:aminoglycoside phosphotransferase (APT) family kinase protein